ncbi:serine/threonine-protein phosphatase [Knoellia locipacati]|uniref:PP2C family protein-serine/threonine phosphatase n=1 Tax=Knoellia locipacati TaxID=882824 RepID=UPI00384E3D5B
MRTPVEGDQPLGRMLDAAENASPLDAVNAVTEALARDLGASAAFFLIADLSGRALVRMSHGASDDDLASHGLGGVEGVVRLDDGEQAVVVQFEDGPVSAALRTQTVQIIAPTEEDPDDRAARWVVLAPVTERGEALGLLQLSLPAAPDAPTLTHIARLGHVLAFVVIANRRHTDLFEWAQRSTVFSLPAEIQRRLLPTAFTCEAGAFTLSAWLEPAASVGGDTFDYCLARNALHLSLTDAMGHGVASALTATLCVGSLRNTRRQTGSLLAQAQEANSAVFEHADASGAEHFATGLLGRLDLGTGVLAMVNAGHVAPYLCRDGTVVDVRLPVDFPLGMFGETTYRSTDIALEPGDRLVMVTDGMLERAAGKLDLRSLVTDTRALHPREATRMLTDLVVQRSPGGLTDDATLMILDWHGGHGVSRETTAGAEQQRTSS